MSKVIWIPLHTSFPKGRFYKILDRRLWKEAAKREAPVIIPEVDFPSEIEISDKYTYLIGKKIGVSIDGTDKAILVRLEDDIDDKLINIMIKEGYALSGLYNYHKPLGKNIDQFKVKRYELCNRKEYRYGRFRNTTFH